MKLKMSLVFQGFSSFVMLPYKSILPNTKVSAEIIFDLTWPTFYFKSLNLLNFLKSQLLRQPSLNIHEYHII